MDMAEQPLLTNESNNRDNPVVKTGELFIKSDDGEFEKYNVELIKSYLYCNRTQPEQQHDDERISINLKLFYSVKSDGRRSAQFYLKDKLGNKSYEFKALSIQEMEEWKRYFRQILPDAHGTTIKPQNKYETAFCIILAILCVVMMMIFGIGAAFDDFNNNTINIWIHGFFITVSLYQITLIILCVWYCLTFKNICNKVTQLMKFNKFWIQSLCCSLYNIITFVLLTMHLIIKLSKDELPTDIAWFFANDMVYLFAIISIPFPVICIGLHHEFKYQENRESNASIGSSRSLVGGLLSPKTSIVSLEAAGISLAGTSLASTGAGEVRSWLENDVQFPQYTDAFISNGFETMYLIKNATMNDLKEIGIDKVGHRRKIMVEIANLHQQNYIPQMNNNTSRKYSMSSIVDSLAGSRPVFRDNMIKGTICLCYAIHFISYIASPSLNRSSYSLMLNIMYPGYDNGHNIINTIIYNGNQIFLRTFVGMTLISVFFTFVTELTDKQIISTSYEYLWRMWKEQKNWKWISILLVTICLTLFEFFAFRDLFEDNINIDVIINGSWIVINLFVAIVNIYFFVELSGGYDKTNNNYHAMYSYKVKSPVSPIKAFVLELVLLLILYLVYILFLILYIIKNNEKQWDIYRQVSILILLFSQFATLIRVKQAQKYPDALYLQVSIFAERSHLLLHGYFKANCLLLVYNTAYTFIFKIQYFGSNVFDSAHVYQNIGFAFSFSLSASILFLLSHFINSYQKWKNDESRPREFVSQHIVSPNPALDEHMESQRKQNDTRSDS